MIPITIINSHTTHKNQETSLKLSVYLDRQKVAAKISGVTLRRKTAWITIGQPLFTIYYYQKENRHWAEKDQREEEQGVHPSLNVLMFHYEECQENRCNDNCRKAE
jgi:hypothetical protein